MKEKGIVKEAGSLVLHTGKAGGIGLVGRFIGRKLGGNVGDVLGGVAAGVIQSKTSDPYDFGPIIALVAMMDFGQNITGAGTGGAAAGVQRQSQAIV